MAYSLYLMAIRPKADGDSIKAAKAAIRASSRLTRRNLETAGLEKWQLARSLLQSFPQLTTLDTAVLSDEITPSELEIVGRRVVSLHSGDAESGVVLSLGNKIVAIEFSASTALDPRRGMSEEILGYVEFLKKAKGYQVYDPQSETIWW